jgi:nitrate reductase assembly molybdenum cofactor insertion protein NarJ
MDPTGVVTLWNQRLSVSLATTLSIWTTGRERGQAIVALLTEYANWQAKLGEPTPVTSVP